MENFQPEEIPGPVDDSFLQIESNAIFQSAKISMLLLSSDGSILGVNNEAKKELNTDTKLIGKNINYLFHGKAQINITKWYTEICNGVNPPDYFIVPLKQKDDTISRVEFHLSLLESGSEDKFILCQFHESTIKKEIEETKAQHDHFLSELINNIPDSIFIKDRKSRFILVNQAIAERFCCNSPDDLKGKTDFDIHPKKLAQKYYNDEQEIISSGQARLNIVEQVIDKRHNIAWHSTSKLPLKNKDGDIIGIMGIGRDITQWVKGQKALRKSKLAAEKADHLKTAFLSNFSHEIRTPLNGILGFSQYLKQTLDPEHKAHEYIEFILRNGKRLLHLISDIIDLSRIESGEISLIKKSFSLNDVMNQLKFSTTQLLIYYNKAKIEVELTMDMEDKNSIIYSDDSRIKQVLYNLLSNSVKFTNKGKISFGYYIEKNSLHFYVHDTGIGIDSKDFNAIFKSFRQVDNSRTRQYEGAGLGLTIAQGLVQILEGKITVHSEIGKGSEFSFVIPIESPPPKKHMNKPSDKIVE